MIINYRIPTVIFSTVKKAFEYDHGAIAFVSAPLAIATNLIMNGVVKDRLNVSGILLKIFDEDALKSILLVLIMFVILTIMYIVTSVFDFITGISASKKEWTLIPAGTPRGYIKSDKLWSSVWKFLAVMVIGSIFTTFTMLFVFVGPDWLYNGFLLILVFFYFMVITFDIHSIGENQERRFGKKPAFYSSLDDFFSLIKNLLTLRIKKIFRGPDDHYNQNYNENENDDQELNQQNPEL